MASITLKYNARNRMALKTIDFIMSLGIFEKVQAKESGADVTRKAMEEVENGEIITCDSYEDYLKRTGGYA